MKIKYLDNQLKEELFSGANAVEIDVKNTLYIIKETAIVHEDLLLNSMGFFNVSSDVSEGKVRFISFKGGGNMTKAKPDNCAWMPNGKIGTNSTSIELCPANIQFEHCHSIIPCWESLFGVGNDVNNILSTPTGIEMYNQLIELVFQTVGNDFYKIAWFGKHQLMINAAATKVGVENPEQWAALKNTLDTCGGWLATIDYYQSLGEKNFSCTAINSQNVNATDGFTGDIIKVFKEMVACADTKFKSAMKAAKPGEKACMLVTPDLFEAYKSYLIDKYPTIPDMLYYNMSGEFCAKIGCAGQYRMEGALLWDGIWIKCMDSWDVCTAEMGINHTRALLTLPRNLAIGVDVKGQSIYGGIGMKIYQNTENPKEAGKLSGSLDYRLGTGILFKDFIVNSSIVY